MLWRYPHAGGIAVVVCLTALLLGCGGGGQETAIDTGAVRFSATFPPLEDTVQPTTIYGDTNSITVDVVDPETNDPVVTQTVINRPDPQGGEVSVVISDIPAGQWLMKTVGWEQEDAGGQALSRAEESVTITTGGTTDKSVIMHGWPYSLDLEQTPYWVLVDTTAQVIVTPRDVESNTLLGNFSYTFSSSDPGVCEVSQAVEMTGAPTTPQAGADADAILTGVANGDATITVTLLGGPDAAPPVTTPMPVHVYDNIDKVVIEPSEVILKFGESATLTAVAKYQGEVSDDFLPNMMWNFTTTGEFTTLSFSGNVAEVTAVSREPGEDLIEAYQTLNSASGECVVRVQ
ncbi:MAG: hypothetical protein R6V19_16225 [Armatimonadota bacterium]